MMVSARRAHRCHTWSIALLVLLLFEAATARAATIPYRTDAELATISERIVRGRVLGVRTEVAGGGTIHTIARIAVLEDFTGNTDPVIEVQELGGDTGSRRLIVPGTPVFTVGQEVVLCLEHTPAGRRYRTVAMSFSAFSVTPTAAGDDAILSREMQHIDLVGAAGQGQGQAQAQAAASRTLSEFRRTVASVKGMSSVRPSGAANLQPDAAAAGTPVSGEFRLLANMRWMQADTNTAVFWYRDSSSVAPPIAAPANVDSLITTALGAWTNPTSASLTLTLAGTRARAAGSDIYCNDNVNLGVGLIMFGDPNNEMSSGTLAIGGGCSSGPTTVVNGTTFEGITHAFVIFNDQSVNTDLYFTRVMTHEVGHGIGLNHPCELGEAPFCSASPNLTENLMYPSCCFSNMPVPPAIGPDDLAGLNFIYPGTTTPPPPPPDPDTDDDGMPNTWELQYGFNPNDPSDATLDADGDGVSNLQEYLNGTHPRGVASLTRYFAEGAVNSFFDTQFALVNYTSTDARVLIRLQPQPDTDNASATLPEKPYFVLVKAQSRVTVTADILRTLVSSSFATVIETDQPIVADRTMSWGGGYGSHAETALTAPSSIWYLAEGAIGGRFSLYYLLQNPNASTVVAKVTYLRRFLPPVSKDFTIAPKARKTIDVNAEGLASPDDISGVIEVEGGGPIIAERAMYRSVPGQLFGAGHESAGVTAPKKSWFLAEGATGSFFDMFVLIANPSPAAATVHVSYLLEGGTTYQKTYTVAANSRFTIPVDDEQIPANSGIRPLQSAAFSTQVDSDQPIIVERSMWWPGGTDWYEASNVVGAPAAGLSWALAEGQVGGSGAAKTYILVANVGNVATRLKVTLFRELSACGSEATTCPPLVLTTEEVPAHSRLTIEPGTSTWFPTVTGGIRFGALVESLDAQPIVIERSMYTDYGGVHWAAGTAAIGTLVTPFVP